ncbi:MAG: SGNH/GDSL hydrolase family protein [Clostridia bacterium]|nr:SGNH/GDSL hydrolase family protein [Clostridia bacterium]
MKSRKRSLIAVLMTMVLCWGLTVPAFAENEAKAVEPASITTEIQGTRKKTILIGDSRTANLRQVRNNGKLIYDLLQQDGSIFWDFKWGATFADLTTTLVPRLEMNGLDTIDNKTKIVLWMGYNDTSNTPTAVVEEYIAYYNLMAMTWIARGAKVYVMNVGPAGRYKKASKAQKEEYKARNKKIRAFNKSLKEGLLPQIRYIDCYGYLMDTDYGTSDGTHYVAITSNGIYKFIMNAIK